MHANYESLEWKKRYLHFTDDLETGLHVGALFKIPLATSDRPATRPSSSLLSTATFIIRICHNITSNPANVIKKREKR